MHLRDLYYFHSDDLRPHNWMIDDDVAYHCDEPLNIRYSEILDKYDLLIDIDGCKIQVKIPWWLRVKYRRLFEKIFKESPRHSLGCCLRKKKLTDTAEKIHNALHIEKIFFHYYSSLVAKERYAAWLELLELDSSRENFCRFIRETISEVKDATLDADRCVIVFKEDSKICDWIQYSCWFFRFSKEKLDTISITLPHFVRNKP